MKTERTICTIPNDLINTKEFDNVPLYDQEYIDETMPNPLKMFLGAWYHKVVSSKDAWLGIECKITLGEFVPDPKRFNLDGMGRYMDNHNVYVGGCGYLESDCGLGYNTMYETCDTSKELTPSSPKLGYRPFYRYIVKERIIDGGNIDVINSNYWRVSDPTDFGNYYFPGDTLIMKVYSPIPNYLQFKVEVVKPTTIEKYVEIRKRYNLKNNLPTDYLSPLFHSNGQGVPGVLCEFKRVNSIDQYGNEGFDAMKNSSKVINEIWHECYLYKRIDNKLVKIPFTNNRYQFIDCPNPLCVKTKEYNKELGGEIINIDPTGLNN